MKLAEHVDKIRLLIESSFRNQLGRLGITEAWCNYIEKLTGDEQKRIFEILKTLKSETGSEKQAYEKLLEEFTFTLFNRLAALKVLEAHTLQPEVLTRREQYAGRSFAHFLWLEQNPNNRNEELEGLSQFIEEQFDSLSGDMPLFSLSHPCHLLPTNIELNSIIEIINQIEVDPQIENDIWKSDDILGWLYESYNNHKKATHKNSKAKTEFDKVSIQSQVYTPRWVVKFLVDNSLGKLYLEMYPNSVLKEKYNIGNLPQKQVRDPKPITEIRFIDPATGSGNFVLYGFDLFYDMYMDQINNYGAVIDERKIPELIIKHNLFGIDIDDRAIQLAQLGLYIKVKRKNRYAKIDHFNIVSSDFYLPDYSEVKYLFETEDGLSTELEKIVKDLWSDLQQAYKFGSLIKLEEKFSIKLHGLTQQFEGVQLKFFSEETLASYEQFRENFFINLLKAVKNNAVKQGYNFLNIKTQDAISFLQILTQKYDIAVANPPYTQSAEYGELLSDFIEVNYKSPINTYENLYACFIQRNIELTNPEGTIAMITPQTFMFIDSFKELRKRILERTEIDILVQYGFGGIFKESVDPAFFILNKKKSKNKSLFIKLDNIFNDSKNSLFQEIILNKFNKMKYPHIIFNLDQNKFYEIKAQPYIYWITDEFRKKFTGNNLGAYFDVKVGLQTGNNERFVRYWWETENEQRNQKWFLYAKGGTFNRWYGNLWLNVNWENNGFEIKNYKNEKGKLKSRPQNEKYYFQEGITYSASGRGGYAFRYLPAGCMFDVGGSSIFLSNDYRNIYYVLGLLNSKLSYYIADCLNPTANIQVGDIQRIPFQVPTQEIEKSIEDLTKDNIEKTKILNSFKLVEPNFSNSPVYCFNDSSILERIFSFIIYESAIKTSILINEAIINQMINEVYELNNDDKEQVQTKMGKAVALLPLLKEAQNAFIKYHLCIKEQINKSTIQYINELPEIMFSEDKVRSIKADICNLYQNNNDLEDFCIKHNVNPINVWFWLKESRIIPQTRIIEIILEFITNACKEVLMIDEDGIIPLIGSAGELRLLDRLERHCLNNGMTSAQFMQLDGLLGYSLKDFIEHQLFKSLCDHLNLYMYLPKTPFIWHLSSGPQQGFEAYIIIYKWNRDSLFKLKTSYIAQREENLKYRLIQLADSQSAQAQNEKDLIRQQLEEIRNFTQKIDELIAEGYDPKLDDGVGKNIAPLQQKGLLREEVLNRSQLEKYLNADW